VAQIQPDLQAPPPADAAARIDLIAATLLPELAETALANGAETDGAGVPLAAVAPAPDEGWAMNLATADTGIEPELRNAAAPTTADGWMLATPAAAAETASGLEDGAIPHPNADLATVEAPAATPPDAPRPTAALDAALSVLLDRLLAFDAAAVPPVAAAVAAGDYAWADQLVAHWTALALDAPLPACWQIVLATDAAARAAALTRAMHLGPPPALVPSLQAV